MAVNSRAGGQLTTAKSEPRSFAKSTLYLHLECWYFRASKLARIKYYQPKLVKRHVACIKTNLDSQRITVKSTPSFIVANLSDVDLGGIIRSQGVCILGQQSESLRYLARKRSRIVEHSKHRIVEDMFSYFYTVCWQE